jgi:FkbM family methyltransferase
MLTRALNRALTRRRGGLGLTSQLAHKAGLPVRPRFAGVSLSAPDATTAWTVVTQIAEGEYRWPGLTPERGWRVVDVGANVGVFALWAERRGAQVTAYEPEPQTYASLVSNVEGKHISPRQAALVGEVTPSVRLYLSGVRSTRHTVVGKEILSGTPLHDHVDVPATTLDAVVGSGCDLLKLDCEGAEFDALLRCEDEVLRRARRIILEFHRVAGSPERIVDRLESAGMEVDYLDDRGAVGLIGARFAPD